MNSSTRIVSWVSVLLLACLCLDTADVRAVSYRPGREFRTINTDIYEICVQKNGRTDVRLVTREPLFDNAYPMVWLEGEQEPQPYRLSQQPQVPQKPLVT